jgi:hypothetical protein
MVLNLQAIYQNRHSRALVNGRAGCIIPYIHVIRPAGQPSAVLICSRQMSTPGFLPFALRAALRAFKFVPDKFVEPLSVLISALPSGLRSFTSTFISGWAGRITPGFLPSALRAALRAFKFVPDKFVLRASCPPPCGPAFGCSNLLPAN